MVHHGFHFYTSSVQEFAPQDTWNAEEQKDKICGAPKVRNIHRFQHLKHYIWCATNFKKKQTFVHQQGPVCIDFSTSKHMNYMILRKYLGDATKLSSMNRCQQCWVRTNFSTLVYMECTKLHGK